MTKKLWFSLGLLGAFLLWTAAVMVVDVQAIGGADSAVGFATLNGWIHELMGVHLSLYLLTDWLSVIPLGMVLGFGMLGLVQWIRRKDLRKVDASLLLLGGFYVLVLGVFLLFEVVVINYRPILIEGVLEASYPSSTTMLVLCVMPTAALELRSRIQQPTLRRWLTAAGTVFTVFMVLARLVSGVHWFTDIVGGILLSGGLVVGFWSFREGITG